MTTRQLDLCPDCQADLANATKCPACGLSVEYCDEPCFMPMRLDEAECPVCGTPNGSYRPDPARSRGEAATDLPPSRPAEPAPKPAESPARVRDREMSPASVSASAVSPAGEIFKRRSGLAGKTPSCDNSGLAVPASSPELLFEIDTGPAIAGHRLLVRSRALLAGLAGESATLRVTLCTQISEPQVQTLKVFPGIFETLDGIELLPDLPGRFQVLITAELSDGDRRPLDCWTGEHLITVKADPRATPQQITVQDRGVLILDGDAAGQAGADLDVSDGFTSVELRPDPKWYQRLARSRPDPDDTGEPENGGDGWADEIFGVLSISVRLPDDRRELSRASVRNATIHWAQGTVARFGRQRQPDRGVTWPLDAVCRHPGELQNLSSAHASISIENEMAWITDSSSSGTWLGQTKLPRGESVFLARGDEIRQIRTQGGDRIDPLKVSVHGDSSPSAVMLEAAAAGGSNRRGTAAVAFVLCDGSRPFNLDCLMRTGGPIWFNFFDDNGMPRARVHDGTGWQSVDADFKSDRLGLQWAAG